MALKERKSRYFQLFFSMHSVVLRICTSTRHHLQCCSAVCLSVQVGEDQSDRAIRQLLSGQVHLTNQLKLLQEAVETTRGAAAGVAAGAAGTGAGPAAPADLARRGDLSLLSAELSSSISQLKCAVGYT